MSDAYAALRQRLRRLSAVSDVDRALRFRIGLEKEGLRVGPDRRIAMSPHPAVLGSPLTHPHLTTDFSEALLEFVTPPAPSGAEALAFLKDLHGFVYRHLGDELIWATSMPCVLDGGESIPLARYGQSNAAEMKTVYRRGLGNRYGRIMQVIAGVHFNFSLSDDFWLLFQGLEGHDGDPRAFRDESYMAMIRNLQRVGWLVPYLFGASPAVSSSFVEGRRTALVPFDGQTACEPFATSLRMGDIGYQNRQEEGTGMKASYDSLDAYIRSLTWAIETPCPHYEHIGVKIGDRYEQLNDHVLQIENEYYSTVRPKPLIEWMERPTRALRRRGIAYVELRSLDVSAGEPLGVGEEQIDFLRVLALFCLLQDSPRIKPRERRAIDENQVRTAHRGRDPALCLDRDAQPVPLRTWATELLEVMSPVAELLDGAGEGPCQRSLAQQREKVADPDRTPSARMLAEMRARHESFTDFAYRISTEHRAWFRSQSLSAERLALFERLAVESLARQAEIEAADDETFDRFLERYFSQSSSRV